MKIRECLVSNSSSSSFCIYGTIISEEISERLKLDGDSVYDFVDKIVADNKLNLEVHRPPEDPYYLGRSWSDIKDDQTGLEFKKDVEKEISKILDDETDIKFGTHEAAWRDG